MISLNPSYLSSFWSQPMVEVNLLIFMNLAGALVLGLLVGYERSYHGRAAGMRTYGIVCMASAALTVFCGYPGFWWGGSMHSAVPIDPSRVIQGIVTGVGFLGAGVIMKEGLNISGLTTAASIWASCAIGVLVGIGFFWCSDFTDRAVGHSHDVGAQAGSQAALTPGHGRGVGVHAGV